MEKMIERCHLTLQSIDVSKEDAAEDAAHGEEDPEPARLFSAKQLQLGEHAAKLPYSRAPSPAYKRPQTMATRLAGRWSPALARLPVRSSPKPNGA